MHFILSCLLGASLVAQLVKKSAGRAGDPGSIPGLGRFPEGKGYPPQYSGPENPIDCSLPGSSARGILQARILEWLAFLSPGNLPNPGIEPGSPALQADSLPYKPPGKLCFSLKAAVSLPPSPPQPYTIASRLTPSTIMPIQRRSLGLTRQRGQGFLSGLFADISLVPRTHAWHMAGSQRLRTDWQNEVHVLFVKLPTRSRCVSG